MFPAEDYSLPVWRDRAMRFSRFKPFLFRGRRRSEGRGMGSGGEFVSFSSIPDWEWEPTDHQEIDAAFSLAESLSAKRHQPTPPDADRRRLPDWGAAAGTSSASRASLSGSSKSLTSALRPITQGAKYSTHICEGATGSPSPCPINGKSILVPSPCQFNLKMRRPTMNFGGHIVYSRTYPEVEKSTMELLEIIKAKKESMERIPLGLDIEWRPTFKRGVPPGKVAVMQICASTDHCYVMHIIHSGIPPILQSLLEDSMSIKVGVGISNDAVKIMKDYNICVKVLEDLSNLANVKLGGVPKRWSLSSLAEMLTCKQLEKPDKIRMGNWATNVLSKAQLQYAATDAFVSWYLYEVLRSLPDAINNQGVA